MVKNLHGGSGHKKFGRKHTTGNKNNKLRISEDDGELYAVATKMLGNSMFQCLCSDNTTRLGYIRGKFSGRGKRDNNVEIGKLILIGLREWDIEKDNSKSKIQKCDLLEVYNELDKQRLKETVAFDWDKLAYDKFGEIKINEDDVAFSTERDLDRERLMQEIEADAEAGTSFVSLNNETIDEGIIDFDDI
jgi:initiation factor 1A